MYLISADNTRHTNTRDNYSQLSAWVGRHKGCVHVTSTPTVRYIDHIFVLSHNHVNKIKQKWYLSLTRIFRITLTSPQGNWITKDRSPRNIALASQSFFLKNDAFSRLICPLHTFCDPVSTSTYLSTSIPFDVPWGSRKRDVFRAICFVLSNITRRLRLPRGSGRGWGKKKKVRPSCAKWSHNSGQRVAGGFLPSTWPEHTQIMRPHCVTARSASAVAPWDLSEAASFISANPLWTRPAAPARLSRALCAATTTPSPSAVASVAARIRDRATVLTIITKKGKVRERKNDTTPGRDEKERSTSMTRRCQTCRHLITEFRRCSIRVTRLKSLPKVFMRTSTGSLPRRIFNLV